MKISGFSIIRNGVLFDYPYLEAYRSLLPIVDELIINVGNGDDSTIDEIIKLQNEFPDKIKIIQTLWPLDNPEKKKGGQILAEQTNIALKECTGDWCIYLQADEVLHEKDHPIIKNAIQFYNQNPKIEALLFQYIHFYGSYEIIQETRSAYRREIRAFKKNSTATSIGDAQSFRRKDGAKLNAALIPAHIYHYGWVRPPEKMLEKTFFMDNLYHGGSDAKNGTPHTGENYKYKKFWGLKRFKGSHPCVIKNRINQKGWNWDIENSPWTFRMSDIKKVILDSIEKLTGIRLFEYKSYKLIEKYKRNVTEK